MEHSPAPTSGGERSQYDNIVINPLPHGLGGPSSLKSSDVDFNQVSVEFDLAAVSSSSATIPLLW